jgi:hypothetical protein
MFPELPPEAGNGSVTLLVGVAFLGVFPVARIMAAMRAVLFVEHLRFLPFVAFARNGGEGSGESEQAERFHRRSL